MHSTSSRSCLHCPLDGRSTALYIWYLWEVGGPSHTHPQPKQPTRLPTLRPPPSTSVAPPLLWLPLLLTPPPDPIPRPVTTNTQAKATSKKLLPPSVHSAALQPPALSDTTTRTADDFFLPTQPFPNKNIQRGFSAPLPVCQTLCDPPARPLLYISYTPRSDCVSSAGFHPYFAHDRPLNVFLSACPPSTKRRDPGLKSQLLFWNHSEGSCHTAACQSTKPPNPNRLCTRQDYRTHDTGKPNNPGRPVTPSFEIRSLLPRLY